MDLNSELEETGLSAVNGSRFNQLWTSKNREFSTKDILNRKGEVIGDFSKLLNFFTSRR